MSLEASRCVTCRDAGVTQPAVSWTRAYIVLGGCLVFVVVLHRATVASILQTWSQDPFAHGYFVVPAAAYLAWSRRERVQSMNLRPAPAALPFLAFLSFLWLLGNLIGSAEVQQFCVVTMFVTETLVERMTRFGNCPCRAFGFVNNAFVKNVNASTPFVKISVLVSTTRRAAGLTSRGVATGRNSELILNRVYM